MHPRARRTISLLAAALLAVAVAVTIVHNREEPAAPVVARGAVSSELASYFSDPAVHAELARLGYDVRVGDEPTDFTMGPATAPTAGAPAPEPPPFTTPLVVVTSQAVAQQLARLGVAHAADGTWTFDLARYLALVDRGTLDRSLLAAAPDPAHSESGATYAALAATVAHQGRALTSTVAADGTLAAIGPLFLRPTERAASADALLGDFLSSGPDAPPLVVVDEAAFVARAVAASGPIRSGTVVMYPTPGAPPQPAFASRSAAGAAVGRLLGSDPRLQELAVQHGWRAPTSTLVALAHQNGVQVRTLLPPAIDPPTPASLAALTAKLDDALHRTFVPTP